MPEVQKPVLEHETQNKGEEDMNKLKWLQMTMRASIVVLIAVVAVTTAITQPQVTRALTGVEVGVCLIIGTAMAGYLFQPLEHEKGK